MFQATHDFIKACERLDRGLLTAIDSGIETVLMIEDVESSSLRTWFRNVLVSSDDQALKELDWRPAVGKYVVRAKYAILGWIDDGDAPRDLPALKEEIKKLAAETDVRHLPDYAPVSTETIVKAIGDFQTVKDSLLDTDKASLISDGEEKSFNLSVRLEIEDIESLAVSETI